MGFIVSCLKCKSIIYILLFNTYDFGPGGPPYMKPGEIVHPYNEIVELMADHFFDYLCTMVAKGVFILSVYIKLHHATKWDYSLIKKQKQAS